MREKIEIVDGRTRLIVEDSVKLFFRMGDERDYTVRKCIDGRKYSFSAVRTDCPFAKVSLVLHENTNKNTHFTLIIDFSRQVQIT